MGASHLLTAHCVPLLQGLRKPDPQAFQLAIDNLGADPSDLLLIDDSSANVESARQVGLRALQYTSTEQLRGDLANLGLPTSR